MIFVGFGFLMTFLRRYSYGAVALNMFVSAVVMVEAILWVGGAQQSIWNMHSPKIILDLPLLIDAAFCAASSMIAFGAFIGKASPTQFLWIAVAQVPLYAVNQHLVTHTFQALDVGGTIVIHAFGAFYGLAASFVISYSQPVHGLEHPKNGGTYLNDITSMIGTLFLWIMWPSFNGALASIAASELATASAAQRDGQFLCIVNTLLSLLGSTIATFCTAALMTGRLNMMSVQNATLAGGVAMGSAAALRMAPGVALAIGLGVGIMSTCGFQLLLPFLDRTIHLGDTCGVLNLHGMPGIYGGIVAGLVALGSDDSYLFHTSSTQIGYQAVSVVVTLAIAISGGLIAALVAVRFNPFGGQVLSEEELFEDGVYWECEGVEDLELAEHNNLNKSRHGALTGSRHLLPGQLASVHQAGSQHVTMGGITLFRQPLDASMRLTMGSQHRAMTALTGDKSTRFGEKVASSPNLASESLYSYKAPAAGNGAAVDGAWGSVERANGEKANGAQSGVEKGQV
ncbi:MAG: hypothetical protein WDW38_001864 [Sanguina aurantia]